MIKPILPFLFLSASHAFQVALPSLRVAPALSRVLIPHALSQFQKSTPTTALHQSIMQGDNDDADDVGSPTVELLVEPDQHPKLNNNHAIAELASKLMKALNTQPAVLFLSLSIFLLPFFLLSAFPDSAWAVQSGGRMGGSFGGGSGRQSSSRSYSAPSRGYNRGYSSGYYSRPNVIVTPGISPFYR